MNVNRQSSRPLYQFALKAPLPAAEKLVFLVIASYYRGDVARNLDFPDADTITKDSGLPESVVRNIIHSLLASGFIEADYEWDIKDESIVKRSWGIDPVIPTFYEYFELTEKLKFARTRAYAFKRRIPAITKRLESLSLEIRSQIGSDLSGLLTCARVQPGLYEAYVKPWLEMERARVLEPTQDEEVSMA